MLSGSAQMIFVILTKITYSPFQRMNSGISEIGCNRHPMTWNDLSSQDILRRTFRALASGCYPHEPTKEWHQGIENGVLWLKGIPGSGKSVMAASIIQQLREEKVPVLYFFFRQIINANHEPVAALRDWLCQILPFSPPLQVRMRDECLRKERHIDSFAVSDLWKDLKFATSAFPKVYCVTDALDEMDKGNDDFLDSLAKLGQWRPANVKVLIT